MLMISPRWKEIQILTGAAFSSCAKITKGDIVYIVRAFLGSSKWCGYEIVLYVRRG